MMSPPEPAKSAGSLNESVSFQEAPPSHRPRHSLVGIGEILWDHLPSGPQMGGAPGNFACHACALDARGALVSRVGTDGAGRRLVERLREIGVETGCISSDPSHPTGRVSIDLADDGQPRFTIENGVAWDFLETGAAEHRLIQDADAVCFGSLAQRSPVSRGAIRELLRSCPVDVLRIFDVNLRQEFFSRELLLESLEFANALKLNADELPVLSRLFGLGGTVADQLEELAERFDLRLLAYTRGAGGSILCGHGCWSDHGGISADVKDTVGAGDSFTVAVTLGFLGGWPVDAINDFANEVAAFVCSRDGATPRMPAHLCERLRDAESSVVA